MILNSKHIFKKSFTAALLAATMIVTSIASIGTANAGDNQRKHRYEQRNNQGVNRVERQRNAGIFRRGNERQRIRNQERRGERRHERRREHRRERRRDRRGGWAGNGANGGWVGNGGNRGWRGNGGNGGWRGNEIGNNIAGDIASGIIGFALGAAIANSGRDNNDYQQAPRPARTNTPTWSKEWYRQCAQRYRSFNAKNGTYMGYDGKRHFCRIK